MKPNSKGTKNKGKKNPSGKHATGVPFEDGNQFWMLRAKHGRDRLFASPADLWEACCEYFQWCIENPLIEIDFRGKDLDEVKIPKMRVFTYQGLTRYLDCNCQYLNDFEKSLVGKDDEISRDFSAIIARIREIIYEQKFTGAAAGFLNPLIISRDLGLKEQTELTNPDGSLSPITEVTILHSTYETDPNKELENGCS